MAPSRPALTEADREARFARLPAWARDQIITLQATVDRQQKRLRALTERPESNTLANPYADNNNTGEQPLYLDNNAHVQFQIGPHHRDTVIVYADGDSFHGDYLTVMGHRAVSLELDAANTFRLKLRD